jgi:N-formylglutamate deformylase
LNSSEHSDVFTLRQGKGPLLLSLPHVGTRIPASIAATLTERALGVEDTDWHLEQLYDFAGELGASVLVPQHSRFVIDLNRPPENAPMYPGANNTELCPTRFFTGDPIYRADMAPDPAQIAARLQRYWQPYHNALASELARIKALHGYALLWDGHSIGSQLPWLFDGRLPDLNMGTANGVSCAPSLRTTLMQRLAQQARFSHITDGRFKGGYITRTYGRPSEGVHAVQLEMCFACYMDERPPWTLDPARVVLLRPLLGELLQTMIGWRPDV